MDRRSWLRSIASIIGLAGTAVALEKFLSPEQHATSRTYRIGKLEDVLIDGARKTIQLEGTSVLLMRRGEQITAFDLTCTHAGCPLAYNAKGGRITCACHGGAFDLDGRPVAGPPTVPLTRFECVVDNGDLLIHIAGKQS